MGAYQTNRYFILQSVSMVIFPVHEQKKAVYRQSFIYISFQFFVAHYFDVNELMHANHYRLKSKIEKVENASF